jgi:hypothetical protein
MKLLSHLRQGLVDALKPRPVLHLQGLVQLKVPMLTPQLQPKQVSAIAKMSTKGTHCALVPTSNVVCCPTL